MLNEAINLNLFSRLTLVERGDGRKIFVRKCSWTLVDVKKTAKWVKISWKEIVVESKGGHVAPWDIFTFSPQGEGDKCLSDEILLFAFLDNSNFLFSIACATWVDLKAELRVSIACFPGVTFWMAMWRALFAILISSECALAIDDEATIISRVIVQQCTSIIPGE